MRERGKTASVDSGLKKTIVAQLEKAGKKGLAIKELTGKCKVKKADIPAFRASVAACVTEGLVYEKKGNYASPAAKGIYPAVIRRVNKTYGFAMRINEQDEVFIPGGALMGAMTGDKVLLKITRQQSSDLPVGQVVSIFEERETLLTGIFHIKDGVYMVKPDEMMRINLRLEGTHPPIEHGDKVLARISKRGKSHFDHAVQILEVYGQASKAAACCDAILALHGITAEFPSQVLDEARHLEHKGIAPKDFEGRLDLRGERIFTIDGADAKDLDDAISLEKHDDHYLLGVHIADVSYYVRYNTALDAEAYRRGTSVYYADRVVSMLPKELSNGICSLSPNEDRLTFSALLTISLDGRVMDSVFQKSIIRSRVKGVYSEVNQLLKGEKTPELLEKYQDVKDLLPLFFELKQILYKQRRERGAPDIESDECKLILDENECVVEIQPRERGEAEMMIEEFMLMANEAAAMLARKQEIPFVYRVHENPEPDKLTALKTILKALGMNSRMLKDTVSAKNLSDILEEARGKPAFPIVSRQVLRSMAKARYSENPIGHYGLTLQDYAHFTSPIRRYPDLTIHRILTDFLQNAGKKELQKRYEKFVVKASLHSTDTEIAAMRAERDCEDCFKAEYMGNHIGEVFEGIITSVTGFGFYVSLANTVEGLVNNDTLPEGQYIYDGMMEIRDGLSGKKYRIGDKVTVICLRVDVNAGNVDFALKP